MLVDLKSLPPNELSKAEQLLVQGDLRDYLSSLSRKQKLVIRHSWGFWGRPDQHLPPDDEDWDLLALVGGRGIGKTTTGSNIGHQWARNRDWHIALVGKNAAEVRDVMVEGPTGIKRTAKPWNPCVYEPSKRRITWPRTGTWATLYNGDEYDQLRGGNFHAAWVDELAKFDHAKECWDQIVLSTRLGRSPKRLVTTTPRPLPILKDLIARPRTVARKIASYRNAINLTPEWFRELLEMYEGTRIGRQELMGDILDDSELALWRRSWIDRNRVQSFPYLSWITVGVDPGDIVHTGIIAAGRNKSGSDYYVLGDDSLTGGPEMWGKQVWATAIKQNANVIMIEKNYGGLQNEHTLETYRPSGCYIPIKAIHVTDGKAVRAQPSATLDEQGRGHHVGNFGELENEMCSWEPNPAEGKKMPSPNRIDARTLAVYGLNIIKTRKLIGAMSG